MRETVDRVMNKQLETWHVILKRHSRVDRYFAYPAPVPDSCRETVSALCACPRETFEAMRALLLTLLEE
jgi:hypothetical protein